MCLFGEEKNIEENNEPCIILSKVLYRDVLSALASLQKYEPSVIYLKEKLRSLKDNKVNNNTVSIDHSKVIEKLENENKRLQNELLLTRGNKAVCLEIDGKDMTDVYTLQRELIEKDTIINFLKKELAHKMSYRQVMKKQYKELKQKYETLYRKCVCCPMCKHFEPGVTVNETIGNACEEFNNGCNNNPIVPFAHFEMK